MQEKQLTIFTDIEISITFFIFICVPILIVMDSETNVVTWILDFLQQVPFYQIG